MLYVNQGTPQHLVIVGSSGADQSVGHSRDTVGRNASDPKAPACISLERVIRQTGTYQQMTFGELSGVGGSAIRTLRPSASHRAAAVRAARSPAPFAS
jgi:hypothetical protein